MGTSVVRLLRFFRLVARPIPKAADWANNIVALLGLFGPGLLKVFLTWPSWVPWMMSLGFGAGLLCLAGLRVQRQLDKLTDTRDVADKLADFYDQGQAILDDLWKEYERIKGSGKLDVPRFYEREGKWQGEVVQFLLSHPALGRAYVVRFESDSGLENIPSPYLAQRPFPTIDKAAQIVARRMKRLEDIMEKYS